MDARQLGQAIVRYLDAWVVVDPEAEGSVDWVDLRRKRDGAMIRLRVGGWRMEGRVAILGLWPRFSDGHPYWGGKSCEITCSMDRDPQVLAKEINRRLLPEWDKQWAEAKEYVETHDRNAQEARGVAERIGLAIGGELGPDHTRRGDGIHIHGEPNAVRRLRVNPSYRSAGHDYYRPVSVDFEVHNLPPEVAAEVLAIIREAENRVVTTDQPVRVGGQEAVEEDPEIETEITPKLRRVAL